MVGEGAMSEKQLQAAIIELATFRGFLYYHPHDSRRSVPGWPDLCLCRGDRLIFAELKSERGKVTPDQRMWLQALERTGAETYLWRPADWPNEIARVLA